LENYPSGDDVADATRINLLIEESIRKQPDQYLWLHKRFKTQAAGKSARPY
jgi:KDO2-lipid IV(A) lauroyltransferase